MAIHIVMVNIVERIHSWKLGM